MAEYKFVIAIQNKIPILVSGPPNIVTDNTDYLLELVTDAEWDGFEAKTVFYGTDSGVNMVHSIMGNHDAIPMQIKPGALYIGISAGELHTTRDVRIPVVPSVRRRSGIQIPEPEPDVYDQLMGKLNNHETRITNLEQHGGGGSGGGTFFMPGNALELKEGKLNVVTTNDAESDNTLPITSAGVYTVVGNINALLKTI